jgi:small subunit ribosomal protein S16
MGARKRPFYRVIIADSRARRDGPFLEIIGIYNPLKNPSEVRINMERARYWIQNGAQPTQIVKKLLKWSGLE